MRKPPSAQRLRDAPPDRESIGGRERREVVKGAVRRGRLPR